MAPPMFRAYKNTHGFILNLTLLFCAALFLTSCSGVMGGFYSGPKSSKAPANLLQEKEILAQSNQRDLFLTQDGTLIRRQDFLTTPQVEEQANNTVQTEQLEPTSSFFEPSNNSSNKKNFSEVIAQYNDRGQVEEGPVVPYNEIKTNEKVKVAILLPLTGQNKEIGQAILNAAQMALFDIAGDYFELIPRDTKGTQTGAHEAAMSAVNSGARLFLGPLFASSTRAVKNVARQNGIKIITFSTDWTLADKNTFVMGFTPFDQVRRVMSFAAEQGNVNQAVLAPYTTYGDVVTNIFSAYARRNNMIKPIMIERYRVGDENFNDLIRKFTVYDERVEALELAIADLEMIPEEQRTEFDINELARLKIQHTEGELPFDAILMPMAGVEIREVTSALKFYDVDLKKARFLGTGLWDDPSIYNEISMYGSWYAAPDPSNRQSFEDQYVKIYGKKPPRIATLGYDATALVAVLSRQAIINNFNDSFSHSNLTNPNGFAGIDGIFRFSNNGVVERGLAVMEITKNGPVIVSPAPKTFQFQRL